MTSLIYNQKWNDFVRECEAETLKENMILDAAKKAVDYVKNAYQYYEQKTDDVVKGALTKGVKQLQKWIGVLKNLELIDDKCDFKIKFILNFFKNEEYIKIWASITKYILEELSGLGIRRLFKFFNKTKDMVGEIPDWVNTIKDKISFFMENIGGILMDLWEMKELKDLFFDNIEQFKEFIKLVKVTDQNFDDMGYSCKTKNTLEMETT